MNLSNTHYLKGDQELTVEKEAAEKAFASKQAELQARIDAARKAKLDKVRELRMQYLAEAAGLTESDQTEEWQTLIDERYVTRSEHFSRALKRLTTVTVKEPMGQYVGVANKDGTTVEGTVMFRRGYLTLDGRRVVEICQWSDGAIIGAPLSGLTVDARKALGSSLFYAEIELDDLECRCAKAGLEISWIDPGAAIYMEAAAVNRAAQGLIDEANLEALVRAARAVLQCYGSTDSTEMIRRMRDTEAPEAITELEQALRPFGDGGGEG